MLSTDWAMGGVKKRYRDEGNILERINIKQILLEFLNFFTIVAKPFFLCKKYDITLTGPKCPKFGQGVRSFDRVFKVWARCPKFGQGVRSLGKVSEVRAHYPIQCTFRSNIRFYINFKNVIIINVTSQTYNL